MAQLHKGQGANSVSFLATVVLIRDRPRVWDSRRLVPNATIAGPLPTMDPPTLTDQNGLAAFVVHGAQAVIETNFVGTLDRLTGRGVTSALERVSAERRFSTPT